MSADGDLMRESQDVAEALTKVSNSLHVDPFTLQEAFEVAAEQMKGAVLYRNSQIWAWDDDEDPFPKAEQQAWSAAQDRLQAIVKGLEQSDDEEG